MFAVSDKTQQGCDDELGTAALRELAVTAPFQ